MMYTIIQDGRDGKIYLEGDSPVLRIFEQILMRVSKKKEAFDIYPDIIDVS